MSLIHRTGKRGSPGRRRGPAPRHSPLRRAAYLLLTTALVAGSATLVRDAQAADSATTLVDAGVMTAAVSVNANDIRPAPLLVDRENNIGFAFGTPVGAFRNQVGTTARHLVAYDLDRFDRGLVGFRNVSQFGNYDPEDIFRFAVDEQNRRVIGPTSSGNTVPNPRMPCNPAEQRLRSYSYAPTGGGSVSITESFLLSPCSGIYEFLPITASIHRAPNGRQKLLLGGTYTTEAWRQAPGASSIGASHNAGQPLIVRQLDLARMYAAGQTPDPDVLDWEIDLRYSGCGRWEKDSVLLGRTGNDLISYCWDSRPVVKAVGAQGYVVRIPLGPDDKPFPAKGSPTLPDPANPVSSAPAIPSGGPSVPPLRNPFDAGPIALACLNAGGPFAPEACAAAALAEAGRQGDGAVQYVQNEIIPALVPGGGPALPDPDNPPSVDPSNPAASRFIANPVVRRTPALPGIVHPFLDAGSGRVLLLTADLVNGNAVWVFDPRAERFIGLMSPGGSTFQSIEKTSAGFDAQRGRAYVFTASGILAAPVRANPLPGGRVYPVYAAGHHQTNWRRMFVAPRLHRIFVPLVGNAGFAGGYGVVQDDIPDPADVVLPSPDTLTAQIDEQEGKTESNATGAAQASGAHVVIVGGLPRVVNQLDPGCAPPSFAPQLGVERPTFNERCLADQVLSTGKREYYLAQTIAGVGTSTGADAEAVGFTAADDATDHDVRNVGACGRSTADGLWGGFYNFSRGEAPADNPFAPLFGVCDPVQDNFVARPLGDDLRNGTGGGTDPNGPDSNGIRDYEGADGFPVPTSACEDSVGKPDSHQMPAGGNGFPKSASFSSSVACDSVKNLATATATSAGIGYPDPTNPLVTAQRTSTTIRSERASAGQITTATATAEGIAVGPLRIARVETVATVRARGRTGTAAAEFTRVWCGIELPADVLGQAFDQDDCVDPATGSVNPIDPTTGRPLVDPRTNEPVRMPIAALIDDLNQNLGRLRLSIPEVHREATSGGYQAVVTKDAALRAADNTVNADDSLTVPALQVIAYNDGEEGLSRVIVQLAGVHTESRYGITRVPDFGLFEFDEEVFDALSAPERAFFEPLRGKPGSSYLEILGAELAAKGRTGGDPGSDDPLRYFQDILRWLINNWREALLLFFVFSILATPVYLGARRRAFERELAL